MSYYLLRPCKGKAAFEAVPRFEVQIDINSAKVVMKANGYKVVDAGIMLVLAKGEAEVSLYPSGKLLIKAVSGKEASEEANKIYGLLGIPNGI
ncbi:MAG: hypothetical protein JSW28_01285 [Thermoplasmata archaeon]|nr:MAG: hypothetical protein JSW28_01285 [Thermoplasmata archaeon]